MSNARLGTKTSLQDGVMEDTQIPIYTTSDFAITENIHQAASNNRRDEIDHPAFLESDSGCNVPEQPGSYYADQSDIDKMIKLSCKVMDLQKTIKAFSDLTMFGRNRNMRRAYALKDDFSSPDIPANVYYMHLDLISRKFSCDTPDYGDLFEPGGLNKIISELKPAVKIIENTCRKVIEQMDKHARKPEYFPTIAYEEWISERPGFGKTVVDALHKPKDKRKVIRKRIYDDSDDDSDDAPRRSTSRQKAYSKIFKVLRLRGGAKKTRPISKTKGSRRSTSRKKHNAGPKKKTTKRRTK